MRKKSRSARYAKWGYIFIAPFFIVFILFVLLPLVWTIVCSFLGYEFDPESREMIQSGAAGVGNFKALFEPIPVFGSNSDMMPIPDGGKAGILVYTRNTLIMWVMGAVPQLILAFFTAVIYTSASLKIKGRSFFRWAVFLPSLMMAAVLGTLFYALLGSSALDNAWTARGTVALISCLMSFGNTAVLLIASISSIDSALFEAAAIEGYGSWGMFCKITAPNILPVIIFSAITSLIGGLQMFDVPMLLTGGTGSTTTLLMWIGGFISSGEYGKAGAASVLVLVVTVILSLIAYGIIVSARKKRRV